MNIRQMAEVYQFNNNRRQRLLDEAKKQPTKFEQLQFVVDYFLNNLPVETICQIDEVPLSKLKLFKYDYSYLEDYNEPYSRYQPSEEYAPGCYAITLPQADVDKRGKRQAKIYPTTFALKKATCQMFANEIERFAMDFDIDAKIINEFQYCYDGFVGKNKKFEPVNRNRIIKMNHYYNIVTIDGKTYKIDIAGLLSTLDFIERNPGLMTIDISSFYFSENLTSTPFETSQNIVSSLQK